MHVYSPVKWNRDLKSACTYYRIEVPFQGFYDFKLAETFLDDGKWPEEEISFPMMLSADVDLFFALAGEGLKEILKTIKQLTPGPDQVGRMRYPPSVVFDIDDNIDYVHPFNNTYSRFGIRGPDGVELEPGDSVYVQTPNGEVPLWEDQKTHGDHHEVFDIAKNKKWVRTFHQYVASADGATFPTKQLGEWYKEHWGLKDYYVFPNSIIPEHYPTPRLQPHDGVRILWQGGMSHSVDWSPLRDVMREIAQENPQVTFVFWGSRDNWVENEIPKTQLERIPWMHYIAYKPWRSTIGADINLCPLVDNMFNRHKSAIKWYEGALQNEATLAANVLPYSDEMIDGETGLLYDDPAEFKQKLQKLIDDVELRKTLADNGRKWVLENRHYEKTVPGLFEYYKELRARKRAEFDEPKTLVEVGANGGDTDLRERKD
jgi:glycosyltransferase involved in cell wall biosynthesis